jgi:hypothetical protein
VDDVRNTSAHGRHEDSKEGILLLETGFSSPETFGKYLANLPWCNAKSLKHGLVEERTEGAGLPIFWAESFGQAQP